MWARPGHWVSRWSITRLMWRGRSCIDVARLWSAWLSPVCVTAATTNPARAKALAVSWWPSDEPPWPCETTTSGKPWPATAALRAICSVNGPSSTCCSTDAVGYQTATASGLSVPSSACRVSKPAATGAAASTGVSSAPDSQSSAEHTRRDTTPCGAACGWRPASMVCGARLWRTGMPRKAGVAGVVGMAGLAYAPGPEALCCACMVWSWCCQCAPGMPGGGVVWPLGHGVRQRARSGVNAPARTAAMAKVGGRPQAHGSNAAAPAHGPATSR